MPPRPKPADDKIETIAPKNDLRKKVREIRSTNPADDPVARAEAALQVLSSEFGQWMENEVETVAKRRTAWVDAGYPDGDLREALYRAVHDLKGQAATLGFPLAADVAASLCNLLDGIPASADLPRALVDQHVDAIRAIFREDVRTEDDALGVRLVRTLSKVTDDVLSERGHAGE